MKKKIKIENLTKQLSELSSKDFNEVYKIIKEKSKKDVFYKHIFYLNEEYDGEIDDYYHIRIEHKIIKVNKKDKNNMFSYDIYHDSKVLPKEKMIEVQEDFYNKSLGYLKTNEKKIENIKKHMEKQKELNNIMFKDYLRIKKLNELI